MKQSQDQFKDYLFINRLTLSQHSHHRPTTIPYLKLSRSTWTKKAMRQKQNQNKLNSFHTFFTNTPHQQSSRAVQYQTTKKNRMMRESSHQNNASCKGQKNNQPPLTIHFTLNRNLYHSDTHQDLAKSGILLQKIECDTSPSRTSNKKSHDPRLFLKSLKIKDNVNLYKGNFNKFQKKDIIHRVKTKRFNVTNDMDVSPWEQDTTRPFFA